MIKSIQSSQLSEQAFKRTLEAYKLERDHLLTKAGAFTESQFNDRMNSLNMSISMTQLFIDNYFNIKTNRVTRGVK